MKTLVITSTVLALAFLTGCEGTSLEQLVERDHQQRIDEANAGRPVAKGARDGIGAYSSESEKRITLSEQDSGR